MKILQLCNKIPYPPLDGGSIAILNISQSLAAAGHQVVVVAMNTRKHHGDINRIPGHLASIVRFCYVDVVTSIKPLPLLFNLLFSSMPYIAKRFDKPDFRKVLQELLSEESFDIVQLEGLYLKPYLTQIRKYHKGIVVYRAHNIENEIWQKLAGQSKNPLKKFYLNSLAKRIKRYEINFMDEYDLLLPISSQDLETFQAMGNTKPALVAATGILPGSFQESMQVNPRRGIFYIGALDWIPNLEGLSWFIDHVWQSLKTHDPNLDFHIAGRNAPAWFKKRCLQHAINFLGEISDSYLYMDEHDILVVPLFAGSGIRIKIIEAMARSKAVVTTTLGAQGLGIQHNKHALIADDAETFLAAIEKLIEDDRLYAEIKRNAYAFAQENFNCERLALALTDFYNKNITC
jgi:polysaccharide biosynthesis protein PslH